jgi:hypothetical protein
MNATEIPTGVQCTAPETELSQCRLIRILVSTTGLDVVKL